jgi:hypothetical protein
MNLDILAQAACLFETKETNDENVADNKRTSVISKPSKSIIPWSDKHLEVLATTVQKTKAHIRTERTKHAKWEEVISDKLFENYNPPKVKTDNPAL